MENMKQILMLVIWALLALACFAGGIFVAMPLGWKIVNFAFGIYNCLIILAFGYINKKDKTD